MTVAPLLLKLRAVAVSISSEGGRLIVDAPPGVITAELRAELVRCKADLIVALEAERAKSDTDPSVKEVRHEIGGLLAGAYWRYTAVQRVPADHPGDPLDDELALSGEPSVHGVVP